VIGTSKGAEAALLLASRDPRICAVAGFGPSSVVWANVGPGIDGPATQPRSSWSECGRPLPFVPYDLAWTPTTINRLPSYRSLYEQSLTTFAEYVPAAAIPVEHIKGDVLLAGGGDDQVWPTEQFIQEIKDRRTTHRLATNAITLPAAGHRIRLPGESFNPTGGMAMARGGTPDADRALGQQVWPALLELLNLPR
jgi:hypothetical protein